MKLLPILIFLFSLSAFGQANAEIISKSAFIRYTPINNGKVVYTASKGQILQVDATKNKNGWYRVIGVNTGWIHANDIKLLPSAKTATADAEADSKWEFITASFTKDWEVDDLYYYRKDSIIKIHNDLLKVWIKIKHTRPKKNIYFTVELLEIKCIAWEYRLLKFVDYDKDNEIVESTKISTPSFDNVIPDSIGEGILLKTCGVNPQ